MTISSETRISTAFLGDGAQTVYAFTFACLAAGDVVVFIRTSTGEEYTLTYPSQYSVLLHDDQDATPGGSVTTTAPPPVGALIYIMSVTQALQPVDLQSQAGFFPDVINKALDRTVILAQEQRREMKRAVIVPFGEAAVTLPTQSARAGRIAEFDEFGRIIATHRFTDIFSPFGQSQIAELTAQDGVIAARITSEATVSATAISAEATTRSAQISTLSAADAAHTIALNTVTAAITSEANTRATAISAEATTRNAQIATVTAVGTANTAAITAEANTRATAISAEATTRNAQIAALTLASDGAANAAAIIAETNARVSAVSAETSARNSQVATLTTANAANTAAITAEATARATQDAAIASFANGLSTTIDGHTATLTTYGASINGLNLKYGVKLGVGDVFEGFELNNGTGFKGIKFAVSNFVVQGASGNITPFEIDTVNNRVRMTNVWIANLEVGSVTSDALSTGAASGVVTAEVAPNLLLVTSGTEQSVVSLGHTSSGGKHIIHVYLEVGVPGGASFGLFFRVYRNGSLINQSSNFFQNSFTEGHSTVLYDQPGAGTHTYEVRVFTSSGSNSNAHLNVARIYSMELKKAG